MMNPKRVVAVMLASDTSETLEETVNIGRRQSADDTVLIAEKLDLQTYFPGKNCRYSRNQRA